MAKDIGATPTEFSNAVALFYILYGGCEPVTNFCTKVFRPSRWLPLTSMLVGVVMLSQGVTVNPGGLLATRLCLGIAESSLFPGVNYLLSGWYKRSEFGIRSALFFSGAAVAGSLCGLLSAALQEIHVGSGHYREGWRWIFIVFGLATFVLGIAGFFLVPNFPVECKWLSERERAVVIARLSTDSQFSAKGEGVKLTQVWKALLDVKTFIAVWIYCSMNPPLYSFATFATSVINEAFPERGPTYSNLISVPIYVWACIIVIVVGFWTSKYQSRVQVQLLFLGIGIVGYIILISVRNPVARYVFLYFACLGSYPLVPNTITLCSQVEGNLKRGVVIGMFVGVGNILGAGSTSAYKNPGAQNMYRVGHGAVLAFYGSGVIATLAYWYVCQRANKLRDLGTCDEIILSEAEYPNYEDRLRVAADAHQQRLKDIQSDPSLNYVNRLIRLARAKTHSLPGGTYASIEQARQLKGDDWSGYRYQT